MNKFLNLSYKGLKFEGKCCKLTLIIDSQIGKSTVLLYKA